MGTQKNTETGKRPGVMLYFDMVEPILPLRDAEKGRLLMAIVNYARDGVPPEFTGRLALAWGYIQPKLDRDADVYENTVQKKKYAAFCKKRTALKLSKIPYQQWLDLTAEERKQLLTSDNTCIHMDTHDNTSYPTGKREGDGKETRKETRKEKGKLYSSYVSAGAEEKEDSGAAAATENKKFLFKKLNGDLGQGVVNLTEHQIERLLDQLGLEMFDYYVKKLSDFILSNNASVKNHYATILRWWMEDQSL